jgi:hypothetical protein
VNDPSKLPQIFIREAVTVRRAMIVEQPFRPAVRGHSEALRGIHPEPLPPLRGYVITTPKRLSEVPITGPEGDAVLAEWQYGVGRAAAFTSDAKNRWGADWVEWPNYRKFWSQLVRSLLRPVEQGRFRTSVTIQGGRGRAAIDAVDPQGGVDPTLAFRGTVTAPNGEALPLTFRQVAPGRYEADFEARQPGTYVLTALYEGEGGRRGYISQGVALPYAEEFRSLRTNMPLLERIRSRTNGRMLAPETPVFVTPETAVATPIPLRGWLLLAALLLLPLDIAVRRLAIEHEQVAAVLRRVRDAVLRRKRAAAPLERAAPALERLLRKKKEVEVSKLAPPGAQKVELEPGGTRAAPPRPAAAPPVVRAPHAEPSGAPPPAEKVAPEAPDYMKRLLEAKRRTRKDKDSGGEH